MTALSGHFRVRGPSPSGSGDCGRLAPPGRTITTHAVANWERRRTMPGSTDWPSISHAADVESGYPVRGTANSPLSVQPVGLGESVRCRRSERRASLQPGMSFIPMPRRSPGDRQANAPAWSSSSRGERRLGRASRVCTVATKPEAHGTVIIAGAQQCGRPRFLQQPRGERRQLYLAAVGEGLKTYDRNGVLSPAVAMEIAFGAGHSGRGRPLAQAFPNLTGQQIVNLL